MIQSSSGGNSGCGKFLRILKKSIIVFFAWRDVLGFYIGGIPVRAGEIVFALFAGKLFARPVIKCGKHGKIVMILSLNLICGLLSTLVYSEGIIISFAIKYYIRNVLIILAMAGFLTTKIEYGNDDIKKVCTLVATINFAMGVFIRITGYWIRVGQIGKFPDNYRNVSLGGMIFYRWTGACTEPGYMAPMLVIPAFYFFNKILEGEKGRKNYLYLGITLFSCLFSFSTAVYGCMIITILYCVKRNKKVNNKTLSIIILCVIAVICIKKISSSPDVALFIKENVFYKIRTYLNYNRTGYSENFSATDRAQHLSNAIQIFIKGNPFQMLIGHGTGAYYYLSKQSGLMVEEVSEAYNLFLSSLTDRGIVGFACLIMTFRYARKLLVKGCLASETIYWGIILQGVHWMLVGNYWLYYFWYEIMLMIGINRRYGMNPLIISYEGETNDRCNYNRL